MSASSSGAPRISASLITCALGRRSASRRSPPSSRSRPARYAARSNVSARPAYARQRRHHRRVGARHRGGASRCAARRETGRGGNGEAASRATVPGARRVAGDQNEQAPGGGSSSVFSRAFAASVVILSAGFDDEDAPPSLERLSLGLLAEGSDLVDPDLLLSGDDDPDVPGFPVVSRASPL